LGSYASMNYLIKTLRILKTSCKVNRELISLATFNPETPEPAFWIRRERVNICYWELILIEVKGI